MLKKQKKYIFAPIFWDRERYLKLKRIIMEKKEFSSYGNYQSPMFIEISVNIEQTILTTSPGGADLGDGFGDGGEL